VGVTGAGDTGEFCASAGAVGTTTVAIAVAATATPPMITLVTGALRFENRCFPFIVQNPAMSP
jgi:hypothetical protein